MERNKSGKITSDYLPKITIITVCYNAEAIIESTMRSVLNQTYENIEYIIVDGKSKDNTLNIIKQIASEYPNCNIKIISEPDKGVYDAMNKGISLATGEWINFMNSGDCFYDCYTISNFFNKVKASSLNNLLYGDVILKYPIGYYYKDCSHSTWCHQSLFAPTEALKLLKFNTSYKIMADEDFVTRAINSGAELEYIPQVVAIYESFDGMSSTCGVEIYKETQRVRRYKKNVKWYLGLIFIEIKQYIKKHLGITNNDSRHYRILKNSVENNPMLKKIQI